MGFPSVAVHRPFSKIDISTEGKTGKRVRWFRGAVDTVPLPHTPGSEILPGVLPAVVLARLHEHHGGTGLPTRDPLCARQDTVIASACLRTPTKLQTAGGLGRFCLSFPSCQWHAQSSQDPCGTVEEALPLGTLRDPVTALFSAEVLFSELRRQKPPSCPCVCCGLVEGARLSPVPALPPLPCGLEKVT